MSAPRLVILLAVGLLVGLAHPALPRAEAVDLDAAFADLDMLKKSTKSKATNEDLLQYLDAVFAAYKDPTPPPKPPEDAPQEQKDKWAKDQKNFEKNRDKFRADAQKLFLKILTLVKVRSETNVRDDVNVKAANILGDIAPTLTPKQAASLSKKIITAIEKRLSKVKTHTVSTDVLDATFAALAKLNVPQSLQWMNKNYTHTKDNEKEYLVAAHKAMVLFKAVPGKIRHEVVAQMIKQYSGVELQAEQVSNDPKLQAKKRFWDEIKIYTVPVVQYFALQPEDEKGQALAEMKHFQVWWRKHKNPKKAPWLDEVKEKK